MNEGYIKLNRKIIDWEWYQEPNAARLFIHCLLMANHKKARVRDISVARGSFITSVAKLSKELGLSTQSIRTALKHLKSTSNITIETTSKYTIISVVNYNSYQEPNKVDNKQTTNKQQTNNKQVTTNKNEKNEKNEKNIKTICSLLLADGSSFDVKEDYFKTLEEAYPRVDVLAELKKMQAWLISNEKKRKTRTGIKRFVNGWLNKPSFNSQVPTREEVLPVYTSENNPTISDEQFAECMIEAGKWTEEEANDYLKR